MKWIITCLILLALSTFTFSQNTVWNIFNDSSAVDALPQFVGGEDAWMNHLQANLRYPTDTNADHIAGIVIAIINIDTTGTFDSITIVNSFCSKFDAEVIRVFSLTKGEWTPASKNGKKVPFEFHLPVSFKLLTNRDSPEANCDIPNVDSLYSSGNQKIIKRDFDAALIDFSRLLFINPYYADFYAKRATCFSHLYRQEDMCADLRMAVKLGFAGLKKMIDDACN